MIQQEPYHYRLCNVHGLTEQDWANWLQIHHSVGELSDPFFHPGLTQCVASIRDDVEVVVISNENSPVGYFPFQRCPGNVAQSVVGRLSEYHGVIAMPNVAFKPEALLRAAGLRAWHFDHLPASQHQFDSCIWGKSESPYMDLSSGYDAYRETVRKRGSSLTQVERKKRKMEREIGPLRFDFHSKDINAFNALLKWKSEQHQRTGVLQIMKIAWVPALLELIGKTQVHDFKGQLSTLHAGENLVAVHLGLRNDFALHIWFPTYNMRFEKYSPGLILLLEMAKQAAAENLNRIELGRGGERYKANFKTNDRQIAEGAIDNRLISSQLRRGWFRTKRWIRSSSYRRQLEFPLNACRKLRQWKAFR